MSEPVVISFTIRASDPEIQIAEILVQLEAFADREAQLRMSRWWGDRLVSLRQRENQHE